MRQFLGLVIAGSILLCCMGPSCAIDEVSLRAAADGIRIDVDDDDVVDIDGSEICLSGDKLLAGQCGCDVPDTDTDGDGIADCVDQCPSDASKSVPGSCGCGVADTDTDLDSTPDCTDGCPTDPAKTVAGGCGCGTPDTDADADGSADCVDFCPLDGGKIEPGVCGCGQPDDANNDGVSDCLVPPANVRLEGESAEGDGVNMMRGTASKSRTRLLKAGQSLWWDVQLAVGEPVSYELTLAYSNDNYGPTETVTVRRGDTVLGTFSAADTGGWGNGWSVVVTEPVGTVQLDGAKHTLSVTISGGDGRGLEVDHCDLKYVSN